MNKKDINKIINILKNTYPDAKCSLDFSTPFELVVAVMLSAQCTDERVNLTTPALFKKCRTIEDFANIDVKELEDLIHPCGFYKNKAKNIIKCANQILDNFNGKVPNNIEDLISLPGIGRKSANVIMLEVFSNPQGIAVDTHCKRISNRLGLSSEKDPSKIEQDLLKQIDSKYYKDVNHLFIWHGRYTCKARNPECNKCCIKNLCCRCHVYRRILTYFMSKFSGTYDTLSSLFFFILFITFSLKSFLFCIHLFIALFAFSIKSGM